MHVPLHMLLLQSCQRCQQRMIQNLFARMPLHTYLKQNKKQEFKVLHDVGILSIIEELLKKYN